MPIYEYECQSCHQKFDSLRPIKEADNPIECRYCHSLDTKRILSVFFAQSSGKAVAGYNSGCGSCAGGHCSSCGH
jgi:putative FmdB family regulatory protein